MWKPSDQYVQLLFLIKIFLRRYIFSDLNVVVSKYVHNICLFLVHAEYGHEK